VCFGAFGGQKSGYRCGMSKKSYRINTSHCTLCGLSCGTKQKQQGRVEQSRLTSVPSVGLSLDVVGKDRDQLWGCAHFDKTVAVVLQPLAQPNISVCLRRHKSRPRRARPTALLKQKCHGGRSVLQVEGGSLQAGSIEHRRPSTFRGRCIEPDGGKGDRPVRECLLQDYNAFADEVPVGPA